MDRFMTISANSLAIRRFEKKTGMRLVRLDMVHHNFNAVVFTRAFIADLTSKIIASKNIVAKMPVFRAVFNLVSFGFQTTLPIRVFRASLTSKIGMFFKGKSFIPSCLSTFFAFIPRLICAFATVFAVAFARAISPFNAINPFCNRFFFTAISTYKGQSHRGNIPYLAACVIRKSRELQENLSETICSQALQECKEGSQTNAYGPERAMKRHERATRKG